MTLPAIGDGEQLGDGNTGETLNVGRSGQAVQIGGTAATLVGFHGKAPADQAAYVASLGIAALSVSGVVGFTSSTSLSAVVTAVNSIIALLVEKGLMAAS